MPCDVSSAMLFHGEGFKLFTAFTNQRDCIGKAGSTFFDCFALAISSGNFGAESDVPLIIAFNDRSEFILHRAAHATPIRARRQRKLSEVLPGSSKQLLQ